VKYNLILTLLLLFLSIPVVKAKPRQPPSVGIRAIVVDERLAALRASPNLSGELLQRISRGRFVAIVGRKTAGEIVFYRVKLTSRTQGWIQREAVISPAINGDDFRLVRLIRASAEWDQIVRAHIFLTTFKRSQWRAEVLSIYAEAAEAAAGKLSRDATRRLDPKEISASEAPEISYFLNFNGLDRYNRQGIRFIFDRVHKQFHYNGAALREIIRLHPRSPEAVEARKRLAEREAL
jgi:hypothetical protein